MFGAESLWLENIILSNHAPVTLVSHDQHWDLGGGEISLDKSNL